MPGDRPPSLSVPRWVAAAVLSAMSALAGQPARAAFVPNYAEWQKLPEAVRHGFVMGVLDRLVVMRSGDAAGRALASGVWDCAVRVRLTDGAMAQGVTDAYRENPELWAKSAAVMLQYVLYRACQHDINQRLRAEGHPSIDAATFLVNLKRAAAISSHRAPGG